MDPLSIAASIVAVVQATDFVLTNCYTFIGRVKSAASDIDKVVQETSLLKGVFLNLQNLAKDDPENATLRDLAAPVGPIAICREALDEIGTKLNSSSQKVSAPRRLLWPFESKKIDEILERIRDQKPTLLLSLATDSANVSRDIREDVKEIRVNLENASTRETMGKVLDWLRPNDPKEKHLRSRRVHEEGSNQWLLKHQDFIKWTETPRQNIWLHGIPGCGKTILCSTVVEYMQNLCNADQDRKLLYYYFDFNDASNMKLAVLLRSLIFQLCVNMQAVPDPLSRLYDECNRGRSEPSEEDLVKLFFVLLDSTEQRYIVIDGLDECPADPVRARIQTLILEGIWQHPGNYNFMIASRKELDIEESMNKVSETSHLRVVQIQNDEVDADVRLHVQRFITAHKRISTWSEPVRKEIENGLVKGSQGMFRWIELQLRSIGSCVLPGAARKKLKQLPGTLNESYDRILESVSEENLPAVGSALMFLAHSFRPLLVEELADAVLVNMDDQTFYPDERSEDPLSVVLGLCSSLVTITSGYESDKDWLFARRFTEFHRQGKPEMVVRFSHYSVKEYFLSRRHEHGALQAFYFTEASAHRCIAESLLVYLITIGLTSAATRPRYERSPHALRYYAAQYWPKHYKAIQENERREELMELVRTLFNTEEPGPYIYWLNLHNQDYQTSESSFWYPGGRNLTDFPSPIYIASILGDFPIWQWLIEHGFRIDDPSGRCNLGDPLQAAAVGNNIEIVRGLLKYKIAVNTDHGFFGDGLQAAAFTGGLETVKVLIEHGATINTEHGEYGNALIAAAHGGHVDVAKLLLEYGANPQLSSRRHGKAIAGAAASGRLDLVTLLLARGVDINDPNGSEGSALYCASSIGDLQLVQMLIRAGADINLVSGELHTALQAACNAGHLLVVRFLLENGANVNSFGGRLDSALQACIDHGDQDIMELLLSHGSDINHRGGLYKYPLYCATFRGKSKLGEILLDRGALFDNTVFLVAIEFSHQGLVDRMLQEGVDVNAQNDDATALQLAISRKNITAIEALLSSTDIEIDARGGKEGTTALQVALEDGNEEVAARLLKMGASVELAAGRHYKPLLSAVIGGNRKLVSMVLDAGADVNGHRGGPAQSALNRAASSGALEMVQILLDYGADVNEKSGEENCSPLQAACEEARLEVAKLLISRGADLHAPTGKEGTPLTMLLKPMWRHDVSEDDVRSFVLYLLDQGADISCPNEAAGCSGFHEGSTPLDEVIWLQKMDLVNLLLSRGAKLCGSSFRIATNKGIESLVQKYIDDGGDVNVGQNVLGQAIEQGHESIMNMLIAAGADINKQIDSEWSSTCALGYAIEKRNKSLVERLLQLGADPNCIVNRLGSALRHAVRTGEYEIANILLDAGADVNFSLAEDAGPLSSAVSNTNEAMVRRLLEAGADVNGDDGSPLVVACTRGKIHIVQILLDAGANIHKQQGVSGYALQRAAEWGHPDICKLLMSKGADINAQGGEAGNPLRAALGNVHTAREGTSTSTIRYLLASGANPNAPPSGDYVSTLDAAVSNGHGDFIDALVDAGADINAYDPKIGTALISSARNAGAARTFKLLDYGANPHLLGGRWGSALHASAQVGEAKVMERLLDMGVSPNLEAGRYGHVLQAACNPQGSVDYMNCIRLLLARKSNVNAKSGKYETALQCAAKHGLLDAVQLLLEHGADLTISGGKFGNAVRAAEEKKHWHVFNFLNREIGKKGLVLG